MQMAPNPPECVHGDIMELMQDNIQDLVKSKAAQLEPDDLFKIVQSGKAVKNSAWCVRHKRKCTCKRALMHIAGTPCPAWSTQNRGWNKNGGAGRLDFVAFAVWLAHRMYLQESFIIHENVRGFPVALLERFLAGLARATSVLKDWSVILIVLPIAA